MEYCTLQCGIVSQPQANKSIFQVILHNCSIVDWNKDYKPGEFPRTPEQRALAAKKYQLLPEDYKPYPDDGSGLGDYPDLPLESGESKDPHYPWDSPELKRNFNEPVSTTYNIL